MSCICVMQCSKSSFYRGKGVGRGCHVVNDVVNAQVSQCVSLGFQIMGDAGEANHMAACGKGCPRSGLTIFHHNALTWSKSGAKGRQLIDIGCWFAVHNVLEGR